MKNKKLVVSVLSTALVSSMAASALAAPNAGIYIGGNVDEYYSIDSFGSAANNAGAIGKVLDAGIENVLFVSPTGEVASLMEVAEADTLAEALHEAALADFETDAYKVIKEDGTQNGTWAAKDDTDLNPGGTGDLTVDSVSAIDATHIKVVFNAKVLADASANAADLAGNYTVSNGINVTAAVVGVDGKTVTLTVDPLTNDTAYTVVVKQNIVDENGVALDATTNYSTGIFFVDHVAPTVTAVAAQPNGDVKVTFSENVAATVAKSVTVNGQTIAPNGVVDNTITLPKAALAVAALENGKSYSIFVNGYDDLAANHMKLYTGTFTYTVNADVTAPVVSSLVAKDEKTLTLTFSEEINGANKVGGDNAALLGLAVTKGVAATPVVATATTTDGKVFTVNLDQTPNALYNYGATPKETTANLAVTVAGYKDIALNLGQSTTKNVTVTKDITAPAFVKAEYDFANTNFVFTLNEGLAAAVDADQAYAANVKIVDANGVLQATVPTAGMIVDSAAGAKTITISNAVADLGLAPGTYTFTFPAAAVKDQSLNGGNTSAAFNATVTVPGVASDAGAPTLGVAAEVVKDQFTVSFSEAVKGGAVVGSATNPANYKLGGVALPAGTIITLDSPARSTATITLPAGSVSKSETKLLTVSGVQDLAGNTMTTSSTTVALTDSVKPVLQSAAVDATGTLVLTFSEDVDGKLDTAAIVDPAIADFVIKVNGSTVADGVLAAGATDTQVKITSPTTNFATGSITVTTATGTRTTVDAAGNTLTEETTVTATR